MLGIGVLASGRAAYYLDSVATGREDYYLGAGEAPGCWLGRHSATLELDGTVEAAALLAVLEGLDPSTGDRLDRARANRKAGFDLTFSAPKSVSIAFALADADLAAHVRTAHDRAVASALEWLERNACVVRRGAGGARELPGDGFIAAAFRHRASRAGDPHLHTHVLVANLTRGSDGSWSALDGRHLFALSKTAGHLYQAQLRHDLTHQLGVAWQPTRNGLADLEGIPRTLIEELSRRREQIVERLDALDLTSARAAQIATLDTRTSKDPELDIESLATDWHAVAASHGVERTALRALTGRSLARELSDKERDRISAEMLGATGLTARSSTFDRRHVLQAWCNALPNGAPIREIEALAERTVSRPEVAPLRFAPAGAEMRRNDRRRMNSPSLGHRYTTYELLALEFRLIRDTDDRTRERTTIASSWAVDRALASRPTLEDDQRRMVIALTTSGRGVDVVVAPAGSGKTYALAAARDAWETSGHQVIGCAVAARAARQLETTAGIPSTTIAALTHELVRNNERFGPRTVLIVDEAGMAGTRTLAPLLDAAARHRAKIVLVGDHRQLPEIDAGGLLHGLDHHLGAVRLTRNRRQHERWERLALTWLRDGRTDAALATYEHNARIAIDTTAGARRARMAVDYAAAYSRGDTVLMLASRWRDVHDLNRRAREHLATAGHLHGPTLTIGGHDYQAGDRIMTLRNAKRIGVANGTTGTINSVDVDRRTITIDTDDHGHVALPAEYLEARGVVHAYATTTTRPKEQLSIAHSSSPETTSPENARTPHYREGDAETSSTSSHPRPNTTTTTSRTPNRPRAYEPGSIAAKHSTSHTTTAPPSTCAEPWGPQVRARRVIRAAGRPIAGNVRCVSRSAPRGRRRLRLFCRGVRIAPRPRCRRRVPTRSRRLRSSGGSPTQPTKAQTSRVRPRADRASRCRPAVR
ncbi:MAG: MobF family relaxase [Actinomycetota bacterium]